MALTENGSTDIHNTVNLPRAQRIFSKNFAGTAFVFGLRKSAVQLCRAGALGAIGVAAAGEKAFRQGGGRRCPIIH
jgi:hypothetical protein